MLITGNQLRAARTLLGVDQKYVADAAGINVNTVRNMEARGYEPITSSAVIVRKVEECLVVLGVEFTNGGNPGVRLQFVDARPHQRDNGEWVVLIRIREGDPVFLKTIGDARQMADHAERRGDKRMSSAVRKAVDDAARYASAPK